MRRLVGVLTLALLATQAFAGAPPRLTVVTTIFPLYDWARTIGGERLTVTQLLPPGVEAHAFAPKPSDVLTISRAGAFIYLGADLEPWAKDLVQGRDASTCVVIEAGRGLARRQDHRDADPHVWLDPVLAQSMVTAIAGGLAQADPAGRDLYAANAARYTAELQALHERLTTGLSRCRHPEILYGGHFAFGYFAARYHLTFASPYAGFSPDAAPTAQSIVELIGRMRATGQTTIFYEELLDPKVARVIAEETGARLELLHGAHNLTREEHARGNVTYLSLMDANLAKLRLALGCE